MSKYEWKYYNSNNKNLSKTIISYNKKNLFNYTENNHYNHIRDIFCLGLLINKTKKILNVLDYGSNILALSNIKNKIKTNNYNFYIYDPFAVKSTKINQPFKITILNSSLDFREKKFDIINFGSSIQYIENFNHIEKHLNFSKVSNIIISHTPFTLKKTYTTEQSNHKNLKQVIYNYHGVVRYFKNKKFKLMFKSKNPEKYIASKKNTSQTFSLNLIFIKDDKK